MKLFQHANAMAWLMKHLVYHRVEYIHGPMQRCGNESRNDIIQRHIKHETSGIQTWSSCYGAVHVFSGILDIDIN